jgi:hypothetical protein
MHAPPQATPSFFERHSYISGCSFFDFISYIVHLLEVLRHEDCIYLVLEYIGGGELYVYPLAHMHSSSNLYITSISLFVPSFVRKKDSLTVHS